MAAKEFTRQQVLDHLYRGESIPSGWTFDPTQDPPVFKTKPDGDATSDTPARRTSRTRKRTTTQKPKETESS